MANSVKNAKAQASKNVASKAPADKAPAEDARIDFTGMVCTVIGGRKHKGKTVGILYASQRPNARGDLIALAFDTTDETRETFWVNQKQIEATDQKVDASIMDAYKKQREADVAETFYIPAYAARVTEKAVSLRYPGWYKDIWFPKSDITTTEAVINAGTDDEKRIYEVAAWRVRKEAGADSYAALKAKQAEFAKLVG